MKTWIVDLISQELSPQQVVNYLQRHKKLSLHYETIYQLIYIDKANVGNLYLHLRVASKPYRKRYGSYDRRGKLRTEWILMTDQQSQIVNAN